MHLGILRLILCCRLRVSEVCRLRVQDIDLTEGTLLIIHSKGDRNRLVYAPDDLCVLCKDYFRCLKDMLGFEPYWFLPGKNPDIHIKKTSVEARFNEFLKKTSFAAGCDRKPTIHALRHAFVIRRINKWMEQGLDMDIMMPYLSKYLGHSSTADTSYYYHYITDAFRIVKEKDTLADYVIPEVNI